MGDGAVVARFSRNGAALTMQLRKGAAYLPEVLQSTWWACCCIPWNDIPDGSLLEE